MRFLAKWAIFEFNNIGSLWGQKLDGISIKKLINRFDNFIVLRLINIKEKWWSQIE